MDCSISAHTTQDHHFKDRFYSVHVNSLLFNIAFLFPSEDLPVAYGYSEAFKPPLPDFCKDKGSCSDMAGNDREVKPIAQKGKVKKSGATQLDAECYTKTMPRPWQVADHFGGARINYV